MIGSRGAEIEAELRTAFEPWKNRMKISRKACYRCLEAYSAFEGYLTDAVGPAEPPGGDGSDQQKDILPETSEMGQYLKSRGIKKAVIVGLATDYCVRETTIAAISAGFATGVLAPAVRGVAPETTNAALSKIESLEGVILGREGDWEGDLKKWLG